MGLDFKSWDTAVSINSKSCFEIYKLVCNISIFIETGEILIDKVFAKQPGCYLLKDNITLEEILIDVNNSIPELKSTIDIGQLVDKKISTLTSTNYSIYMYVTDELFEDKKATFLQAVIDKINSYKTNTILWQGYYDNIITELSIMPL